MPYPKTLPGTEICVTVEREGVFLYGNRQAFQTLSGWMRHLADSPPSEHYELHLRWHLDARPQKRHRIWVLFDALTRPIFRRRSRVDPGFEVTFMVVEPSDLRRMRKFEANRSLPKWWRDPDARGTNGNSANQSRP